MRAARIVSNPVFAQQITLDVVHPTTDKVLKPGKKPIWKLFSRGCIFAMRSLFALVYCWLLLGCLEFFPLAIPHTHIATRIVLAIAIAFVTLPCFALKRPQSRLYLPIEKLALAWSALFALFFFLDYGCTAESFEYSPLLYLAKPISLFFANSYSGWAHGASCGSRQLLLLSVSIPCIIVQWFIIVPSVFASKRAAVSPRQSGASMAALGAGILAAFFVPLFLSGTFEAGTLPQVAVRGFNVTGATATADGSKIIRLQKKDPSQVWSDVAPVVLNARSGEVLEKLQYIAPWNPRAVISPDGNRAFVSAVSTVQLWNLSSSEPLKLENQILSDLRLKVLKLDLGDTIYGAAFSPDSTKLATTSIEGRISIWNAETGAQELTWKAHNARVFEPQFSSDGKLLMASSGDGTISIWSAQSGNPISRLRLSALTPWVLPFTDFTKAILPFAAFSKAAFSKDGRSAYVSNNTISAGSAGGVWDVQTGKMRFAYGRHKSTVNHSALSADESTFVTASADGTAIVWDAKTGAQLQHLKGHAAALTSVAFSPVGDLVATGSYDKKIKVWNVASGRLLATLKGHGSWIYSLAFLGKGDRLVSTSFDETTKFWDVRSLEKSTAEVRE